MGSAQQWSEQGINQKGFEGTIWISTWRRVSSKMMVVSLLTIVIELSPFYQGSGESFVGPPIDTVNDYIQACCEAWKIIELVENLDPKAVLVNKQ
jgi:hypothetical protein